MTVRVRIFSGALDALADKGIDEVIDKAMAAGVASAQRLAPVDTGELRDDIAIIEPASNGRGSYGASVEHALPVEFGTGKMAAQPYLRPSLDAMKQSLR